MAQNRRQRARDGRAENEGGDSEQVEEPRVASDAEDGAGDDEAAGDLGDEQAEQRHERASIDVSRDIPEGWRQELAGSLRKRRGGRRLIHASPSFRRTRCLFFACPVLDSRLVGDVPIEQISALCPAIPSSGGIALGDRRSASGGEGPTLRGHLRTSLLGGNRSLEGGRTVACIACDCRGSSRRPILTNLP